MKNRLEQANFKAIEGELYYYHDTLKEISNEKMEIIHSTPSVDVVSKSSPGAPTESKAVKILSSKALMEAERRTNAITEILKLLEQCDEPNKLKLVKYKYFEKKYTDMGIWTELNIGQATFYRWRKEIVQMIADKLGWRV